MNSSSITTQPVFSHLDKPKESVFNRFLRLELSDNSQPSKPQDTNDTHKNDYENCCTCHTNNTIYPVNSTEYINSHKNNCEKCITCDSTGDMCPANCDDFCDRFNINGCDGNKDCFCSLMCFPTTLTINTLFCSSCTLYNICRNNCANNEESKNYLC